MLAARAHWLKCKQMAARHSLVGFSLLLLLLLPLSKPRPFDFLRSLTHSPANISTLFPLSRSLSSLTLQLLVVGQTRSVRAPARIGTFGEKVHPNQEELERAAA